MKKKTKRQKFIEDCLIAGPTAMPTHGGTTRNHWGNDEDYLIRIYQAAAEGLKPKDLFNDQ